VVRFKLLAGSVPDTRFALVLGFFYECVRGRIPGATMCVYLLTGFYFSLRTSALDNLAVALVQPFASFCFQVAYEAGTLFGLTYLFRQPSIKPIRFDIPIQQ
jgi:hypothetical protein